MTTRELFDYITDITIQDEDEYLTKKQEHIASRGPMTDEEKVQDEVFMQVSTLL